MFKKVAVGILIAVGVLIVGVSALTAQLNRNTDSEPLAERLATLPKPDDNLVLIETWARDGFWGIQNRDPEAGQRYMSIGTVADGCLMLDQFYEAREIAIQPISRSGNPLDWCGRSIHVASGRVSVWVEQPASWIPIPEEFEGVSDLVTIEYRAHR